MHLYPLEIELCASNLRNNDIRNVKGNTLDRYCFLVIRLYVLRLL